MPRIDLIQPRTGTALEWTAANPILALNEMGEESDTGLSKRGDAVTEWNSLPYFGGGGSQNLQTVTDGIGNNITTNDINIQAELTIGDGIEANLNLNDGSGAFINADGGNLSINHPDSVSFGSNSVVKNGNEITSFAGDYDASTNTPALSNLDTNKESLEYLVSVSGTQDFGAGNSTFEVGDIISNNGTVWYKKVNNSQSIGTGSGAFIQSAFSTIIAFDENRISSFGDVTDNSHDQTAEMTFTYDLTGAKEEYTRNVQINSNGDPINIPLADAQTAYISNQATLSVNGFIVTPLAGNSYTFIFEYTNGYVRVLIIDSNYIVPDVTPPTFTVAPAASSISDTSFNINAQTDEDANVYAVTVPTGAATPTDLEIIAGTASGGGAPSASGNALDSGFGVTIAQTGLTASTGYDTHVVARDLQNNIGAIVIIVNTQTLAAVTLPDVSTYDLGRIYAVQKTSESIVTTPISITDGNSNDYELFWDGSGEISLSSNIGTGTTETADTLQDYIDNIMVGTTIYVNKIRCHITGLQLTNTTSSFKLWDSTNGIAVDNAKTAIQSLGTGEFEGAFWSELNDGNDFSIIGISSNSTAVNQGTLLANSTNTAVSYIGLFNDRRTQKRIGLFNDDTPTLFLVSETAQDNTANQKRHVITLDANGDMSAYKNGTLTESTDVSANIGWTNAKSSIGGFSTSGVRLTGKIQFIGIHSIVQTPTQVTNLDAELSTYLGY